MSEVLGPRRLTLVSGRLVLIGTSACVLLGLTLLTGCGGKTVAKPAGGGEKEAMKVPYLKPTCQQVTRLILQPAYIKAYEETPIYSKIAGFVEHEPPVDKGTRVKKGDLLVELRVPEMEADLKRKEAQIKQMEAQVIQAKETRKAADANVTTCEALIVESQAGVAEAEADCQRWMGEYERGKKLAMKNVYDKETLDEALNQYNQSKAGKQKAEARVKSTEAMLIESKAKLGKAVADITAAEANLDAAKAERDFSQAMLDYRVIRAPYEGEVTARNVHTEAFVQPSSSGSTNRAAEPLFVVMRMDKMRITLQVPETDAVLVKDGMKAKVQLQAFSNEVIEGEKIVVTRSSGALDERARTLLVEIDLDNTKRDEAHKLRPGMYAYVTIEAVIPKAWTIPNEALVSDEGDNPFCFEIKDGKAVRMELKTSVRTDDNKTVVIEKRAKATNALKPPPWEEFTGKEMIVARNPAALIDGQPVTAVADSSESPTAAK